MLGRHPHLEDIPEDPLLWEVQVRGAVKLAETLASRRDESLLYRDLATLRTDVDLPEDLAYLRWRGIRREALGQLCGELGERSILGP